MLGDFADDNYKEKIQKAISEIDKDGDGEIDFEEFKEMMKLAMWYDKHDK